MDNSTLSKDNFLKTHEITLKDLPLACPGPLQPIWNLHPKIFLKLNAQNQVTCPYCSTHYILKVD
ncbi:MAG: hypothetical protein JWM09_1354 [Francisellaceae bacterium]|nr:hypothetical protein [Francisellaceae bacterium]